MDVAVIFTNINESDEAIWQYENNVNHAHEYLLNFKERGWGEFGIHITGPKL